MDPTLDDQFERQFFFYVLDVAVTANSTQFPSSLQILSDADFEWWWILASRTSNLLKVLMKEAGTGRDFIGTTVASGSSNVAFNGINIDNWAGTAQGNGAFPLAVPYVMPATRVYQFYFTDTSGSTNNVELVFSGFKLWPSPQPVATGAASQSGNPGVSGYRQVGAKP